MRDVFISHVEEDAEIAEQIAQASCAVSPDGSWIVSASWDETLKMWRPRAG